MPLSGFSGILVVPTLSTQVVVSLRTFAPLSVKTADVPPERASPDRLGGLQSIRLQYMELSRHLGDLQVLQDSCMSSTQNTGELSTRTAVVDQLGYFGLLSQGP